MFHKILVAIDGPTPATGALAVAAESAARYGAALDIMHVMDARPAGGGASGGLAEVEHIVSHVAPRAIPTRSAQYPDHVRPLRKRRARGEGRRPRAATACSRRPNGGRRRRVRQGEDPFAGGDYADGILDAAKDSGGGPHRHGPPGPRPTAPPRCRKRGRTAWSRRAECRRSPHPLTRACDTDFKRRSLARKR